MENRKLSILMLFNHQLTTEILSGGERMFVEMEKRFEKLGVSAYSAVPQIAVSSLRKEKLNHDFFIIPGFKFEYDGYHESMYDLLLVVFVFIYRSFYGCFKIFRWLEDSGAEVIYSPGDFIPNVLPAAIAKLFGKKIRWVTRIHHLINNPFERKGISALSNIYSFLMQRLSFILIKHFADAILLENAEVKSSLLKRRFDTSKIFVIDLGIDLDKIKNMPFDYPEPFDACYIGRLSASKGISDLLNIWRMVIKDMPVARLAIVGGGSSDLVESKKKLVWGLKLQNNVKIFGFLPDEEAYRIRKTSKIFLSCSYEEGWGISVAESLACGIPCIVYDLPVYIEKFGKAVTVVPKGNLDNFTETAVDLIRNAAKRKEMGLYGKEVVKKYDIEEIAKQEIGVIKKICGMII